MEAKMIEKEKETRCPYPGIDLAFDWVKGVLDRQKQLSERYNDRLSMLFSVATAILGIGLPFGAKLTEGAFSPGSGNFITILIAVGAYFAIAILAIIGFWMRDYRLLDNPVVIREDFWALSPWKFKEQILVHLEDAYELNNSALKWKVWPAQIIIGILPVETLALVLAFILVF
jgi:hypothetical protein